MGLAGVTIKFSAGTPALRDLVAEAERLGGLKIEVDESPDQDLAVAFAAFPEGRVSIRTQTNPGQGPAIFIIDFSQIGPVLYRLLWQTAISMGGEKELPDHPLPLPLTEAFVRREIRRNRNAMWLFYLLLLGVLLAVVALVGGAAWLLWRLVFG